MSDSSPAVVTDHHRGAPIVVVDDEPDNVVLLQKILGRSGFTEVVAAHNADEKMDALESADPQIVIVDLHMPGTDGFGFLERLQRRRTETRLRALVSGAHDLLTKPFDAA